jgi:hypothetical protein
MDTPKSGVGKWTTDTRTDLLFFGQFQPKGKPIGIPWHADLAWDVAGWAADASGEFD